MVNSIPTVFACLCVSERVCVRPSLCLCVCVCVCTWISILVYVSISSHGVSEASRHVAGRPRARQDLRDKDTQRALNVGSSQRRNNGSDPGPL